MIWKSLSIPIVENKLADFFCECDKAAVLEET